jgi:two-component system cell cycle sensor histidine kinase/response regulator CckA
MREGLLMATSRLVSDQPVRVLLVDDEPVVQSFVGRVLREAGYDTMVASDAVVALGLWDTHGPFNVLVTDLMMPGMLGEELARTIQARTPDVKVIYLTGFTLDSYATPPTLGPNEAYVEKPVSVMALQEAMSQLILGHA